MALLTIRKVGDSVLSKPTRVVTNFDKRLHTLLDDMRETLSEANGAGLAAPQVGILRRVAVVDTEETGYLELINPEIILSEGEQDGTEGCLSVPGVYGYVVRPSRVTVRACDRFGNTVEHTVEGFAARAFCHEIDHLEGLMYTRLVSRFVDPNEESADQEDGTAVSDEEQPS